MRILYVSADQGGCRHYRCLLPAQELSRNGHNVLVAGSVVVLRDGELAAVSAHDTKAIAKDFDVVVFQRWMHEDGPRVIRRARALGQAVINDVDDWFFGIPTSNAGFHALHPKTDPGHNVDHYRRVLAASSALTVSTPYLAQRLASMDVPTYVLRNAIDLHRWSPQNRTTAPGSPFLAVGWLGHVGYRADGDLGTLRGVLGPWLDTNSDWRFLHVGASRLDPRRDEPDPEHLPLLAAAIGVDPDRIDVRAQCNIVDLPSEYARFDLGLAPLEDCPFNRAKSWIKMLEYSAAGVPSLGSDMPEYRAFGAATTAGGARAWRNALDELADPKVRAEAAAIARRRAVELDIARLWPLWESVYYHVVNQTVRRAVLTPEAASVAIASAASFKRGRIRRNGSRLST